MKTFTNRKKLYVLALLFFALPLATGCMLESRIYSLNTSVNDPTDGKGIIIPTTSNNLGEFSISGITSSDGTTDTSIDANLNYNLYAKIHWTSSVSASSYDVTIYNDDGTNIKCSLITAQPTFYDFSSCQLSENTFFKVQVTAKNNNYSLEANNSLFRFYVGYTIKTLDFTGNSLPTAPITTRMFGATGNEFWNLTGTCDQTKGNVSIGGNGIGSADGSTPIISFPCPASGEFSTSIAHYYGAVTDTNTQSLMNNLGSEVLIFQNSNFKRTRLYPFEGDPSIRIVNTIAELQTAFALTQVKVILNSDIDLTSIPNWTPIYSEFPNQRSLYGDGRRISNLKINNGSNDYAGFFSKMDIFSVVDSVEFYNADVRTNGNWAGGVVAWTFGASIFNTTINGPFSTVRGNNHVGGIVGEVSSGGYYYDCTSSGIIVSTSNNAGGIFGRAYRLTSSRMISLATVFGADNIGGIIGYIGNSSGGTLTNSTSSGFTSCTGASCKVGGAVGRLDGYISSGDPSNNVSNVSFFGTVSTSIVTASSGPIVGWVDTTSASLPSVTGSYFLGTITCSYCNYTHGIALTAALFKQSASYIGWDFLTPTWVNQTEGVTNPLPRR